MAIARSTIDYTQLSIIWARQLDRRRVGDWSFPNDIVGCHLEVEHLTWKRVWGQTRKFLDNCMINDAYPEGSHGVR